MNTYADKINPSHYQDRPAGIPLECIEYTRHLPFCQGNAAKYVYRAGRKDPLVQDLRKAEWYIQDHLTNTSSSRVLPAELLRTIEPNASTRAGLFYRIVAGEMEEALASVRVLLSLDEDTVGLVVAK